MTDSTPRTAAGREHIAHHERQEIWHAVDGRRDEAYRAVLAIEAEAAAPVALDVRLVTTLLDRLDSDEPIGPVASQLRQQIESGRSGLRSPAMPDGGTDRAIGVHQPAALDVERLWVGWTVEILADAMMKVWPGWTEEAGDKARAEVEQYAADIIAAIRLAAAERPAGERAPGLDVNALLDTLVTDPILSSNLLVRDRIKEVAARLIAAQDSSHE